MTWLGWTLLYLLAVGCVLAFFAGAAAVSDPGTSDRVEPLPAQPGPLGSRQLELAFGPGDAD